VAAVVFSGSIRDGDGTFLGVTKTGTGTQILSGMNTYSGTIVAQGKLILGSAGALGDSYTEILGGATLDLNGQAVVQSQMRIEGTGVGGVGALVNSAHGALDFRREHCQ